MKKTDLCEDEEKFGFPFVFLVREICLSVIITKVLLCLTMIANSCEIHLCRYVNMCLFTKKHSKLRNNKAWSQITWVYFQIIACNEETFVSFSFSFNKNSSALLIR